MKKKTLLPDVLNIAGWACVVIAGCSDGGIEGNWSTWRIGIMLVLFGLSIKLNRIS